MCILLLLFSSISCNFSLSGPKLENACLDGFQRYYKARRYRRIIQWFDANLNKNNTSDRDIVCHCRIHKETYVPVFLKSEEVSALLFSFCDFEFTSNKIFVADNKVVCQIDIVYTCKYSRIICSTCKIEILLQSILSLKKII